MRVHPASPDFAEYITSFLADIPGIETTIKDTRSGETTQWDLELQITRESQEATLLIETKSSAEPRIVANWLQRVPERENWPKRHHLILCAPYVSDGTARMLKRHGVGYIDLSGNCWLDLGFLFIERMGHPNRFKAPKEQQILFSPRASRIVRALLENPAKEWTLQELARRAEVSLGLVHRVNKALDDRLFAEKRRGHFSVQDPGSLLDAWRTYYVERRIRWQRYYRPMSRDMRLEMEEVATKARETNVVYAFTGPAAASLVAPHLMVSALHCYVDVLKPELLSALKADPIGSGGNLWLSAVQIKNISLGFRLIEGLQVVDDFQVYLDLCTLGGRGEEAAEMLRQQRIGF